MTITVGIVTPDGVVFGADTQFGDGWTKTYRSKITDVSPPTEQFKMFIVAAGYDEPARVAIQAIRESVRTLALSAPISEVKEHVDHGVSSSWTKTTQFQLLIPLWRPVDGKAILLSNTGKKTVEEDMHRCLGAGSYFGDYCIPQTSPFVQPSTREALLHSARTLYGAKRYADGCGGESELRILTHSGTFIKVDRNYVNYVEHQIRAFEELSTRMLMKMGASTTDSNGFVHYVAAESLQIGLMHESWQRANLQYPLSLTE
jgi:hypothetical protein